MFLPVIRWLALTVLALASLGTSAQEIPEARDIDDSERSAQFGAYTVHFSVFNSAFVPPDIAEIYQINRASNRALINISVTREDDGKTSLGLPAEVTGTASNLLQQMRTLNFQTISEGDATYYLADLKHTNEEVFNFAISVTPEGTDTPLNVKFSRKLYLQGGE